MLHLEAVPDTSNVNRTNPHWLLPSAHLRPLPWPHISLIAGSVSCWIWCPLVPVIKVYICQCRKLNPFKYRNDLYNVCTTDSRHKGTVLARKLPRSRWRTTREGVHRCTLGTSCIDALYAGNLGAALDITFWCTCAICIYSIEKAVAGSLFW